MLIAQQIRRERVPHIPPVPLLPEGPQVTPRQPDRELLQHLQELPPVTGGITQQLTPDLHLKGRYIQDLQAAVPELLSQELPVHTSQDQAHGLSLFIQGLQAVLQAELPREVQVRVLCQDLLQHLHIHLYHQQKLSPHLFPPHQAIY